MVALHKPGTEPLVPQAPVADRAARAAALLALFGGGHRGFSAVLDDVVESLWQRSVVARLQAVAPEVLGSAFKLKLRAGLSTYLGLGLSSIVCARRRPRLVRAGCQLAAFAAFEKPFAIKLGSAMLRWFFSRAMGAEADRIACGAALILVLDEIFDDVWCAEDKGERQLRMRELIQTGAGPDVPLVRAARALSDAISLMDGGVRPQGMRARLCDWVDAEHALDAGVGDPVAHRDVGIVVSMELLAFAAEPGRVGDAELLWMNHIAGLGQMVDDVLDLEKDARAGRATPAVRGVWTVESVAAALAALRKETLALVSSDGTRGVVLDLYLETFDDELRRMVSILIENP
jgi:hypothetical protein